MTGITSLSLTALTAKISSAEFSAEEVARAYLEHIEATDRPLRAWVHLAPEHTLAQARAVDEARRAGLPLRKIAGVPFGVKDIFNTTDFPTEMGSPIWKDFTPGNDARVVYDLRYQGGIILGKTATAEFAVHQLGETVNPHDPRRNPGTSSSGSAVAVAMGQTPLALATQTAGSIIRPSSYCGIYGFKPSFGLIPRTAILKTTDSLDTVGFMARGRDDLRTVFDIVRVKGADYPISNAALSDEVRQTKPRGRRWRILFAKPYTWNQAQGYARALLEGELRKWLATNEVDISEDSLPEELRSSHEVHALIYERTLSYYFAEEARKHRLISAVLNEMIERGRRVSLEQYKQALSQQAVIAAKMDAVLANYDAVVTLSVSGEPPLRDEPETPDSALIWTLCGLPAINVPAMIGPTGLPVGLQLVARRYNDPLLLRLLDFLGERELAPAGPYPRVPLAEGGA